MKTLIKRTLVSFVLLLIVFPLNAQDQEKSFVIVLDAGHGGHDSGNKGNGYSEKDIALDITLKVGKLLKEQKDIKVIYTRDKDLFVTLRGRAKIANDADADLFVSIHCNYFKNKKVYGTETFVLGAANSQRNFDIAKKENEVIFLEEDYEEHYEGFDPNSPETTIGLTALQEDYLDQSILLAGYIESNFKTQFNRKSRGRKQSSLWVMHNTYMPSVLVEVGFLTNKKEGKYLNSSKGKKDMAKAIATAIVKYKNDVNYVIEEKVIDMAEMTTQDIYPEITFKVQIAASSRRLEPKPYNFKGLTTITRVQSDKLYKYFYGSTSDYSKIKLLKEEARSKGFTNCFIVAYKNGNRISLTEALKTPSE